MSTRGLRAGTAKIDITPPLSIPYLGFVPRQAPFAGVHDPLHARAMVIDDGETQVAVVAADAIGFSDRILNPARSFQTEFRQRLQQRTGITPEAVMLATSHAHSTPETLDITPLHQVEGAVSWVERLIDQLVTVVVEAQRQLQPARLKAGVGQARGIAVNRRQLLADGTLWQPAHGEPPAPILRPGQVDEEVGVVLVEFEDGACSVLVNFTCHAVSVQVQPLVSADFPGVACAMAEQIVPQLRHCLFIQGAAGNINPRGGGMRKSFADVARYGHILGGEIIKVVEQLRAPETAPLPPRVEAGTRVIELPPRDLPDPAPYRAQRDRARGAVADAADGEAAVAATSALRVAEESLRTIETGGVPLAAVIQAIRLGDACVVSTPGELFVELGLEIKAQSPARHTFVAGYANGYAGYLSTPTAFREGGYETSLGPWCHVGPEGGRLCVDAALDLMWQLFKETDEDE